MFCQKCGEPIPEGAHFCTNCGIMVEMAQEPEPIIEPPTPVAEKATLSDNEKEFIENTRRLLRWEQKAWKISGIVMTILGAFFIGIFGLLGLISLIEEPAMGIMMFSYSIIYGMFLAIGIISLMAAKKIPFYLDTIDRDFHYTADRCGSIGMLVFTVFFNEIALVFFLINFVRMKNCQTSIKNIIAKQK